MKVVSPLFLLLAILGAFLAAAFLFLDKSKTPHLSKADTSHRAYLEEAPVDSLLFNQEAQPKINGVCFVGGRREIDGTAFAPVKSLGAGWVCFMPYAFSRKDSAKIWFDVGRQWWGEKTEGVVRSVELAREKGFKIMLKPHLWISWSGFTGDFGFENEKRWEYWEQDYARYILHHARLADSLNIEMFCLGTELERFTQARPAFWKGLIKEVRKVYSGTLTYAANWDEYPRFPFWEDMDYIGIDAYFPLSELQEPTVKRLVKAWDDTYIALRNFSKKHQKKILFTEYGYRSVDFCANKPWESYRELEANPEAQAIALEALYQRFSSTDWYAGGFVWKWFDNPEAGGPENTGYTPQNKPAEKIIQKWYQKMQ